MTKEISLPMYPNGGIDSESSNSISRIFEPEDSGFTIHFYTTSIDYIFNQNPSGTIQVSMIGKGEQDPTQAHAALRILREEMDQFEEHPPKIVGARIKLTDLSTNP